MTTREPKRADTARRPGRVVGRLAFAAILPAIALYPVWLWKPESTLPGEVVTLATFIHFVRVFAEAFRRWNGLSAAARVAVVCVATVGILIATVCVAIGREGFTRVEAASTPALAATKGLRLAPMTTTVDERSCPA